MSNNDQPPYSAAAVANWFLARAKVDNALLTPLKIQKLVYFAHAWWLSITGEPLIKERVQAWRYGPVISSLYREFRNYGNGVVREPATTNETIPLTADSGVPALLEQVWTVYGKLTAGELSELTHSEGTPWHAIYEQHGGEIPMNTAIENDVIKDLFQRADR